MGQFGGSEGPLHTEVLGISPRSQAALTSDSQVPPTAILRLVTFQPRAVPRIRNMAAGIFAVWDHSTPSEILSFSFLCWPTAVELTLESSAIQLKLWKWGTGLGLNTEAQGSELPPWGLSLSLLGSLAPSGSLSFQDLPLLHPSF
jgi:hypothetical protein